MDLDKLNQDVDLLEIILSDIKNQLKLPSINNPDNMRLNEIKAKLKICIQNIDFFEDDSMNNRERKNDEFDNKNHDMGVCDSVEDNESNESMGFEHKNLRGLNDDSTGSRKSDFYDSDEEECKDRKEDEQLHRKQKRKESESFRAEDIEIRQKQRLDEPFAFSESLSKVQDVNSLSYSDAATVGGNVSNQMEKDVKVSVATEIKDKANEGSVSENANMFTTENKASAENKFEEKDSALYDSDILQDVESKLSEENVIDIGAPSHVLQSESKKTDIKSGNGPLETGATSSGNLEEICHAPGVYEQTMEVSNEQAANEQVADKPAKEVADTQGLEERSKEVVDKQVADKPTNEIVNEVGDNDHTMGVVDEQRADKCPKEVDDIHPSKEVVDNQIDDERSEQLVGEADGNELTMEVMNEQVADKPAKEVAFTQGLEELSKEVVDKKVADNPPKEVVNEVGDNEPTMGFFDEQGSNKCTKEVEGIQKVDDFTNEVVDNNIDDEHGKEVVDGQYANEPSKQLVDEADSNELTMEFIDEAKEVVFTQGLEDLSKEVVDEPAKEFVDNQLADEHAKEVVDEQGLSMGDDVEDTYNGKDRVSLFEFDLVTPNVPLTCDEQVVAYTLFSMKGPPWEHIFKSPSNMFVTHFDMETLAPNLQLSTNVIDVWSDILNVLELYKDDSLPSRYFFKISVINPSYFIGKHTDDEMLQEFIKRINESFASDEKHLTSLEKYDMLFFPVCHEEHMYLISIDFRNHSIKVIDNSSLGNDFSKRYYGIPEAIKKVLVSYLYHVKNSKSKHIEDAKISRMQMKWRTKNNHVDCGVFLMLHMETYNGLEDWDCGLRMESQVQKKQLNLLRSRFAAKILLSDLNLLKNKFLKLVQVYEDKPVKEMKKIIKEAVKNRRERELSKE